MIESETKKSMCNTFCVALLVAGMSLFCFRGKSASLIHYWTNILQECVACMPKCGRKCGNLMIAREGGKWRRRKKKTSKELSQILVW